MRRLALCVLALVCAFLVGCVRLATPAYARAPAVTNTHIYECVDHTLSRLGWRWGGRETLTIPPGKTFTLCGKTVSIAKGSNLWNAARHVLRTAAAAARTPAKTKPIATKTLRATNGNKGTLTDVKVRLNQLSAELAQARSSATNAQQEATTAKEIAKNDARLISDLQTQLANLKGAKPTIVHEPFFSPWGWLLLATTVLFLGLAGLLLFLLDAARHKRIHEKEARARAEKDKHDAERATEQKQGLVETIAALQSEIAALRLTNEELQKQQQAPRQSVPHSSHATSPEALIPPLELWVTIEPTSLRGGSSAPIPVRVTDMGRHTSRVRNERTQELRTPLWGFGPWSWDDQKSVYMGNPIALGYLVMTEGGGTISYETNGLVREIARSKDPHSAEAKWLGGHGYQVDTDKPISVRLSSTPIEPAEPIPQVA